MPAPKGGRGTPNTPPSLPTWATGGGAGGGPTVHPAQCARIDRERRFVPAEAPPPSAVTVTRPPNAPGSATRRTVGRPLRTRVHRKVPAAGPGAVRGLAAGAGPE